MWQFSSGNLQHWCIRKLFSFSINLGVFLFIVLSSIFLLEILIRFILPIYDPSGTVDFYRNSDGVPLGPKNSTVRQRNNAGDYNVIVRFNKYGFRDEKDISLSMENDLFVVGDSFGFGWGVEENKRFSNILNSMLGVPVYNISALADLDEYGRLVKYAKQNGASIKNLIIGVCMENDLKDYGKNNDYKESKSSKLLHTKMWLTKKSAIYNAFTSIVHQTYALKKMAINLGLIDSYGLNVNEYSEEILESSRQKIAGIANNFKAIIVIVPSRGLWIGKNKDTEISVHNKFLDLLRSSGLLVVDLKPIFEKSGDPMQYHFKNDGHWNDKGHLKVAETIAHFVANHHKFSDIKW